MTNAAIKMLFGTMPQHPASSIRTSWNFSAIPSLSPKFSAPGFQPKPIESRAHTKIAVTAPAIK
jgi:hypothetical protein